MNKLYNMDQLKGFRQFDARKAIGNFEDSQAYFDQLDYFMETARGYLKHYNPAAILRSEDIRRDFSNSLESVKSLLAALEMSLALDEIKNLENALSHNGERELSDGLAKLHVIFEMSAANIASTLMPAARPAEKKVILAVDDNPQLLTSITGILESEYRIIAVTSANAAIKAMSKFTLSLFLLDIEMPVINGYKLAEIIRGEKDYKSVPILFLTSKASRDHVITAFSHGGNDYILKPVDKELLLNKIRSHLGD